MENPSPEYNAAMALYFMRQLLREQCTLDIKEINRVLAPMRMKLGKMEPAKGVKVLAEDNEDGAFLAADFAVALIHLADGRPQMVGDTPLWPDEINQEEVSIPSVSNSEG